MENLRSGISLIKWKNLHDAYFNFISQHFGLILSLILMVFAFLKDLVSDCIIEKEK